MDGILDALLIGFIIGLTGALAPGPTLIATISTSLKGGWTAGPKVGSGHAALEAVLFVLIVGGVAMTPDGYADAIAVIGGIALIVFGIVTIAGSRNIATPKPEADVVANPYLAGIVTSAANPYFWIWWLTVGSMMLMEGMKGGVLLAGIFMIGHWGADLGWLTLVSTGIHRGRSVLSINGYRTILIICGVFLILFGAYYLLSSGALPFF